MRGTSNGSSGGGGGGHVPRGGRPQPPRPANSMEQDSFDSFEDDESELQQQMQGLRLGVPANGLGGSNGSVNSGGSGAGNNLNAAADNEDQEHELPKSVIVTNVDLGVFDTQEGKVRARVKRLPLELVSLRSQVKYLSYFRTSFEASLVNPSAPGFRTHTHTPTWRSRPALFFLSPAHISRGDSRFEESSSSSLFATPG